MNLSQLPRFCGRMERGRGRSNFDSLCAGCLGVDGEDFGTGGLNEPLKWEFVPRLVFSKPHNAQLYLQEESIDEVSYLIHFVADVPKSGGGLVDPSGKVHFGFADGLFEIAQLISCFEERRWSRVGANEVLNGPWP